MKKLNMNQMKGFTLVELLIVIALIAILSVAVLATINPVEQANKAKDASIQNDAAEVLNAYERFYANATEYPWVRFNNAPALSNESAIVLESNMGGFGICYADPLTATSVTVGTCNTSGASVGKLIDSDELKGAFATKGAFKNAVLKPEDKLWTVKLAGSGGSIYVCYIPKSKASRQSGKLNCINSTAGNENVIPVGGACVAKAVTATDWATPVLDGAVGMFRCVPE